MVLHQTHVLILKTYMSQAIWNSIKSKIIRLRRNGDFCYLGFMQLGPFSTFLDYNFEVLRESEAGEWDLLGVNE